jgi:hypothetical protein
MAGALTAGVVATPAIAAEQPAGFARFEKAQAKRKFVVYAPTTTLELPLTYEGAKVQVYGECAGGRATCDRSTPAGVKRQAYTTVTLPGSAVRPTQTYVEVYSQQVTLAQLREFIRGLVPAT